MQIEVYESDAEALDAAAALAESTLVGSPSPAPVVALAGGRGGRALMLALSGRGALPWTRTRFCMVDDEPSSRALLREHLLAPRGIAPGAAERADGWEAEVRGLAGPELRFDLLVLAMGERGEIGVLDAGTTAGADPEASIVRGAAGLGLGPAALRRAHRVIVVAVGGQQSRALAAAVRPGAGAALPAHLVLPSERVTWFVDRAAAADLLRDAHPAPA
jgi:6-phosphogluconolactonase/glucosamine-6-phosphate isomerase/deaminase